MTDFFYGKNVLITGHTGFKGSWLSLWLKRLGANITGISLDPLSIHDSFNAMRINEICNDVRCNILDFERFLSLFKKAEPEIVFHLAAQALVLDSYKDPLRTFNTNIIGTVNLLEACRRTDSVKVIVVVTSDKCYENKDWLYGYRETDVLGGKDPYSSSKACAEIVTNSFRESFFRKEREVYVATARAGNVIGGGDWAENRILPDSIRSLRENKPVQVRNPNSIRPWQHVLVPLSGYLKLAEQLYSSGEIFAESWNFGPEHAGLFTVRDLVTEVIKNWGSGTWDLNGNYTSKDEAGLLVLDISKTRNKLNWYPRLDFSGSVKMTIDWYKAYLNEADMRDFSVNQIECYEGLMKI